MKVVGRVWIRRQGIYIVYFIQVKEGEWLRTNNTTIQAKPNRLHKKFNLSRNFKQWATKITGMINELPTPTESNWQKEWEVDERLVRRMFGL
jgi:hypothetical protein